MTNNMWWRRKKSPNEDFVLTEKQKKILFEVFCFFSREAQFWQKKIQLVLKVSKLRNFESSNVRKFECSTKVLFDDFDVICGIEADSTVLSAFAPALFVLILKLFESVTCEKKPFKKLNFLSIKKHNGNVSTA